jgi:hypothetical protein
LILGFILSLDSGVLSNELGNNEPDILKSLVDADAALTPETKEI